MQDNGSLQMDARSLRALSPRPAPRPPSSGTSPTPALQEDIAETPTPRGPDFRKNREAAREGEGDPQGGSHWSSGSDGEEASKNKGGMSVLQNLRRRSSAKSVKHRSSTAPPPLGEDKSDKSGNKPRFGRLRKKSFGGLVIPSQNNSSSSSLLPSPLFVSPLPSPGLEPSGPLPSPGLELAGPLSAPEATADPAEPGDETVRSKSPILLASPILLSSREDDTEQAKAPHFEASPDATPVQTYDMKSAEKRASLLASLAATLSPPQSTPKVSPRELSDSFHHDEAVDLQEIALRDLTLDAAASALGEEETQAAPQTSSLSKSQKSRQSRTAPEQSSTSEDSSTDDYGSASDKEGLSIGNSEKEGGDDGGDGPGRNPPQNQLSVPADHTEVVESDSDESDDGYGSDKGLEHEASGDPAVESDSSEDVPLGEKVPDAERLQEKLKRRMLREQALRLRAARSLAKRTSEAKKASDASRSISVIAAKQAPTAHAQTSRSTSISQQPQNGLARTPRTASLNASDLATRLKSLQDTSGRSTASAHPDPSARPGDLPAGARPVTAQTLSRHASLIRQQAIQSRSAAEAPQALTQMGTADITRKLDSTVLRSQSLRGRVPSARVGAPPVPAMPRHLAQVIGSPEALLPPVPSASRDSSSEIGIPESRASLNLARAEAPPPAVQETAPKSATTTSVPVVPHRIFIITKQRYVNVELRQDARARDLVVEVMSKGSVFNDESIPGGWVIFDVSAALGIGEHHR